jgi:hypothetical protein
MSLSGSTELVHVVATFAEGSAGLLDVGATFAEGRVNAVNLRIILWIASSLRSREVFQNVVSAFRSVAW